MINIRKLIQNVEKGQSATAVRYIIMGLDQQYEKIKNKIKIVNSKEENNGTTIFFNIPSSDKDMYYDVVLWVESAAKINLDTMIKVYSNSPSFAYNFAYIFNAQNGLLYPEKFPHEFVLMPPKVRNPYGLYGFDRHVYAAIKTITKINLTTLNQKFINVPPSSVMPFNEKQAEIERKRK